MKFAHNKDIAKKKQCDNCNVLESEKITWKFHTSLTAIYVSRLKFTAIQIKRSQMLKLKSTLKNMIVSYVPKRTFLQIKAWFNIWTVSTWEFLKRRKNVIFIWSDFMAGKISQEYLSLKEFLTWLTATGYITLKWTKLNGY